MHSQCNRWLSVAVSTCWIILFEAVSYHVFHGVLWKSAMQWLRWTGCGLFSVWRRPRTSISSQIPCDRPTWQQAQLCRGGCISSPVSCLSLFFSYPSPCLSFSFYSTYFESPSTCLHHGHQEWSLQWCNTPSLNILEGLCVFSHHSCLILSFNNAGVLADLTPYIFLALVLCQRVLIWTRFPVWRGPTLMWKYRTNGDQLGVPIFSTPNSICLQYVERYFCKSYINLYSHISLSYTCRHFSVIFNEGSL